MALNTSLKITDLDFDTIKNNLRLYLNSQTEFKDYDFEGSGLNVIMDLLAYNTHYMAFYLNMLASEMFLDSSVLRNSVVSHSKQLGYTPQSKTSAKAVADIDVILTNASTTYSIPSYTKFTSLPDTYANNASFTFFTIKDYSLSYDAARGTSVNDPFKFTNIELYEGTKVVETFRVDSANKRQKYIISNTDVDTVTIQLTVTPTNSGTPILFSAYDGSLSYTTLSPVYFLQEVEDEKYEIYFGDGTFGKALQSGEVITVTYLTTTGEIANNVGQSEYYTIKGGKTPEVAGRTFRFETMLSNMEDSTICKLINPAVGGTSDNETLDSIKYLAPRSFATQNRVVTVTDYKTLLIDKYPNAEAAIAWSGEDNIPPEYGTVFVSLKPKSTFYLTDFEKKYIKDSILDKYKVIGVETKIVDPDYVYVIPSIIIKFDPIKAVNADQTIIQNVTDSVKSFTDQSLNLFDSDLRFSKFSSVIDKSDISVKSNETSIKLKKHITVFSTGVSFRQYELDFNNSFIADTLTSDTFTLDAILIGTNIDDPADNTTLYKFKEDSGILQIVNTDGNVIWDTVGTVDSTNGKIVIDSIALLEPLVGYISLIVDSKKNDIYGTNNQIVTIDSADISITLQQDYE